jgi:hypothetical protein
MRLGHPCASKKERAAERVNVVVISIPSRGSNKTPYNTFSPRMSNNKNRAVVALQREGQNWK